MILIQPSVVNIRSCTNIILVLGHIDPECAIGYKKLAQEMVGSPMILGVWGIRKKVPVKYLIGPF